jgi:hypothetical protein
MNKLLLVLIFAFLILGVSEIILAEEFEEGIKITEGKNIVNISYNFSPIYVKDLIKIYPEITTITFNDGNQEIGYVNVLGGIGENFIISENNIYEITTRKEVNLNLK